MLLLAGEKSREVHAGRGVDGSVVPISHGQNIAVAEVVVSPSQRLPSSQCIRIGDEPGSELNGAAIVAEVDIRELSCRYYGLRDVQIQIHAWIRSRRKKASQLLPSEFGRG